MACDAFTVEDQGDIEAKEDRRRWCDVIWLRVKSSRLAGRKFGLFLVIMTDLPRNQMECWNDEWHQKYFRTSNESS
jgi:hypothetical protein